MAQPEMLTLFMGRTAQQWAEFEDRAVQMEAALTILRKRAQKMSPISNEWIEKVVDIGLEE